MGVLPVVTIPLPSPGRLHPPFPLALRRITPLPEGRPLYSFHSVPLGRCLVHAPDTPVALLMIRMGLVVTCVLQDVTDKVCKCIRVVALAFSWWQGTS